MSSSRTVSTLNVSNASSEISASKTSTADFSPSDTVSLIVEEKTFTWNEKKKKIILIFF